MIEQSQALIAIPNIPKEMAIIRDTSEVLEEAKKAAQTLNAVISKKEKPVMFNGQQFLEFEDWQTAGQFYGYTVETGEAVSIEVDGIKGAKAKAKVLDKEGRVVGGAEAFCMRDEANWMRKPWFQLASMAQTRAGSKALRNRLAWFVVLAGFKTTPAEELERHTIIDSNEVEPGGNKIEPEATKMIAEIHEKIAAIKLGDALEMSNFLQKITTYKDKKSQMQKWLTFNDLPGVAKNLPHWIKGIHEKVCKAYQEEFGSAPVSENK